MGTDAVLVEVGGYRMIVDPSEVDDDCTIVTELETLRSWDHGERTSEELCADVIAEVSAWIMDPVLFAFGLRSPDWFGRVVGEYGLQRSDWSGLWSVTDADLGQALYEHADEMRHLAHEAGFLLESDDDCGTTWLYAPNWTD